MSERPWIPVPFGSLPDIASGTLIEVVWSNGSTAIYLYCVDKSATATNGIVARVAKDSKPSNPPVAYRLHSDDTKEAETRKARIDHFRKIAAGRDHLIEEALKTRTPVKAPQKERV